ncbi:glycosyltransferase family 2 protein [Halocola ammonii]
MSKNVEISVVVITFNEERNIGRCLKSVQKVADEIIVVDSHSKDRTQEIAKSLGARVIPHDFEGYIEQKNWALDQASNDVVLSLDADEALNEQLADEILKVKTNFEADGYIVNRLTNYCGTWIKHGKWYPDRKLRLWKRSKGKWGGTNPHDKVEMEKGSKLKRLEGHLLHYSFYTFDEHLKQIERFTNIASRAAFEKGKRASSLNLILNPLARFVSGYFFRLGLLDGKAGFTIARYSAYAKYLKYKKLLEIQKDEG